MKKNFLVLFSLVLLSNCEALTVEDISDETVVLLAPSDGVTLTNGAIQFDWQDISEATNYEIQIATPTFQTATQIVLDSITSSTSISKNLDVGDYEWRVKAMNSDSETNYTTQSFSIN